LISLVAIPLRGRMPVFSLRTGPGYAPKTALEKPPQLRPVLRPGIDFKLLKCLILRFA
jgi:hypothetical protein